MGKHSSDFTGINVHIQLRDVLLFEFILDLNPNYLCIQNSYPIPSKTVAHTTCLPDSKVIGERRVQGAFQIFYMYGSRVYECA